MAKSKKQATNLVAAPVPKPQAQIPLWQIFFRDQRDPLLRSQLLTALMSGHQLETERIPTRALLDALVLSMIARNYHEAEIVDDYGELIQRVEKAWKDPMWTRRTFDQTHTNLASFIIMGKADVTAAEDTYLPELVGTILAHDPPSYLKEAA